MAQKIVCLETATTNCSVALFDGQALVAQRECNDGGFSHGEKLHSFIDEVLHEAGIAPGGLDAVAVSKGPGSYTGLRIGVSAAKGLAYALDIPLVSVDTLGVMVRVALGHTGARYLVPMLDARRMEVYTAVYRRDLSPVEAVRAEIVGPDSFAALAAAGGDVCFFGDGMDKCREILGAVPGFSFLPGVFPSACYMGEEAFRALSEGRTEDVAYFEPFYLKDFVSTSRPGEK